MTATERKRDLSRRTDLTWTAGDGVHCAQAGKFIWRLRITHTGDWSAAKISDGRALNSRVGTWDQCVEWIVAMLKLEAK